MQFHYGGRAVEPKEKGGMARFIIKYVFVLYFQRHYIKEEGMRRTGMGKLRTVYKIPSWETSREKIIRAKYALI
jgi:hypothetical protein